jgi:hypothetical protein
MTRKYDFAINGDKYEIYESAEYETPILALNDKQNALLILGILEKDANSGCDKPASDEMTYEKAKLILDPNTTLFALADIEYYAGFDGERAKIQAVNAACKVACEVLDTVIKEQNKNKGE